METSSNKELNPKKWIENIVYQEEQSLMDTCDVGILFGGFSMLPNRANKALELYKQGMINRILISGGIGYLNTGRKIPEALKIEAYLYEKGIPQKEILVEPNSRNTYENILFSLKLLKESYKFNQLKLALITSDYHLKRCMGIMKKEEDQIELYGVGAKNGITDKENWSQSLSGIRNVCQEAMLLYYYASRGLMDKETIQTLNRQFFKKEK